MAQAQSGNSTGAMVTIIGREGHIPSLCVCTSAMAGIMHIDSFVAHDPLDHLNLPAAEGGLTYLGRIKLDPIDDSSNRTVVADHYMKWAFHFLVDADPTSPSHGLPLRLYGSNGVRMIYSNWTLGDPRGQDPQLFEVPTHCLTTSQVCRDFRKRAS